MKTRHQLLSSYSEELRLQGRGDSSVVTFSLIIKKCVHLLFSVKNRDHECETSIRNIERRKIAQRITACFLLPNGFNTGHCSKRHWQSQIYNPNYQNGLISAKQFWPQISLIGHFYRGRIYVVTEFKLILPVQVCPSPAKPMLQEQVKEPFVLVHSAFVSQVEVLDEHSSISGR